MRTTAAAPSFGEQSIHRWSGSQTTREARTDCCVHFGAEHRVRVEHSVTAVLHDHRRKVVLGDTGALHQALRPEREVGGGGGEPDSLLPGLEERRADDAAGHLLHAEDQCGVDLPDFDRALGERERGAAARATCLDVDDGHPGHPEPAENLVPGRDAPVCGGAEGGLEAACARCRLPRGRVANSDNPEIRGGHAFEPPERVDPDTPTTTDFTG